MDSDGDGFGDSTNTIKICVPDNGYISDATDCNDNNPSRYPNAIEECNGADDDCDGITDENDSIDALLWYLDSDGDGFGDLNSQHPHAISPKDIQILPQIAMMKTRKSNQNWKHATILMTIAMMTSTKMLLILRYGISMTIMTHLEIHLSSHMLVHCLMGMLPIVMIVMIFGPLCIQKQMRFVMV